MIDTKKFMKGAAADKVVTLLKAKSDANHKHEIADVNNLQTTLDDKAASDHGHEIAKINGLQAALDGKAAAVHTHEIAGVNGLQEALDGKAAKAHNHAMTEVTGLEAALNGKAEKSHQHEIAEVNQLQTKLDEKASQATTYTKDEVDQKLAALPSIYTPMGSKASLDEVLALTNAKVGQVYDVKAKFNLGGLPYTAGTNVVCIKDTTPEAHGEDCWDALGGSFDTSNLAGKEHTHTIANVTGLQEALNAKVETTKMNEELGKKADTTYVNGELAKKADTTYVDDELKKKADQATMTTELAKKADQQYVVDELAKKADQATMTTELGKKADKQYVDTELGKKAEKVHTHAVADVTGLQDKLDAIDAYTVNGKAINGNPVLAGTDISINGFKLSDKENAELNPVEGDSVNVVFGKVYKAIQDNELVTTTAFGKIKDVLGVEATNFTMPDLNTTNYLKGQKVFVDAIKALDTQLKAANDKIATLEATIQAIQTSLALEVSAADIEAALKV